VAKYIRSRYPSVHIGPPQTFVAHTKNADGCSAEFKMHDVGLSETVSFCSSHTIETHIERQRFARTLDEIRRLDAHGRHVSAFTGPPVPERIRIEVAHGTAACRRALATKDLAVCASIGWDQTDSGRDFECECACACACAYESERELAFNARCQRIERQWTLCTYVQDRGLALHELPKRKTFLDLF
jgi:hypothetical protein